MKADRLKNGLKLRATLLAEKQAALEALEEASQRPETLPETDSSAASSKRGRGREALGPRALQNAASPSPAQVAKTATGGGAVTAVEIEKKAATDSVVVAPSLAQVQLAATLKSTTAAKGRVDVRARARELTSKKRGLVGPLLQAPATTRAEREALIGPSPKRRPTTSTW